MSGYGNNYRGTHTDNNGLRPNSGHVSDHTEGRKRPIIPYMPNHSGGSIITKTEIVEHVIMPTIIKEYNHSHATDDKWYKPSSPVKHYAYADDEKLRRPSSPLKSYGPTPTDEKWRRPSSPVKSYYGGTDEKWRKPSSPVKNFGATEDKWRRPSSPGKTYGPIEEKRWTSPSGPVKDYENAKEKWRRAGSPVKSYGDSEGKQRISPSGPMKDYGYTDDDKWHRPSDHQRQPKEVEEFITNVQTEASRPNKFVPMRARNWQQTPNNNGYDQSYNNGYYPKNQDEPRDIVTSGGWVRPTRTTWSAPPTNGSLSSPTNSIGAAVEMLKEAVQPNSQATYTQPTRYQVPVLSRPNMDGYSSAVIDSREAAKRYGNFSLGSRPVENYTNTIDSREATRKYGGLRV
ncbi:hypothetical protein ACFE04_005363 [Oxalis oulophora]